MITLKIERRFFIIGDSVRRVEERVHMRFNHIRRIVRKKKSAIDIILIGVIDRVLVKMMAMNLLFPFFNM